MCCLKLHPLKKNANKGLFTPYRAIRKRYSKDFLCALLLLSIASLKIPKARSRFRVGFFCGIFFLSYRCILFAHNVLVYFPTQIKETFIR